MNNNTTTELPLALTVAVYAVTIAVALMAFVFAVAVVAYPIMKRKAFKKGEINERRRSNGGILLPTSKKSHEEIPMVALEAWKTPFEELKTSIEEVKTSIEEVKQEQQMAIKNVTIQINDIERGQEEMKEAIAAVEAKIDARLAARKMIASQKNNLQLL